jgi:hypothetical protein
VDQPTEKMSREAIEEARRVVRVSLVEGEPQEIRGFIDGFCKSCLLRDAIVSDGGADYS